MCCDLLFQNASCSLVCCQRSSRRMTWGTCLVSTELSKSVRCWGTAPGRVKPVPLLPSLVNSTPLTLLKPFTTRKRWRWVNIQHVCHLYPDPLMLSETRSYLFRSPGEGYGKIIPTHRKSHFLYSFYPRKFIIPLWVAPTCSHAEGFLSCARLRRVFMPIFSRHHRKYCPRVPEYLLWKHAKLGSYLCPAALPQRSFVRAVIDSQWVI